MTDETRNDELTEDEVKAQDGEPLPDREAMMLVNPGIHPPPLPAASDVGFDPVPPETA